MEFDELVSAIETKIDVVVDSGTDHDLFISAYVRGHFDLAVSRCLNQHTLTKQDLNTLVSASLQENESELSPDDYASATGFWQRCLKFED